jgi:hypothetical protein
MQKVITIPRELVKEGDLVVMPRAEYEEYLGLKKIIPIIMASRAERKAIKEGRREIQKGKYLTLQQFKNEVAS